MSEWVITGEAVVLQLRKRMTRMKTTVSPQNAELLQAAVASGRFKNQDDALSAALRLLQEHTANGSTEPRILPPDEWLEEFDRITASRQRGNPRMDDSRESIYGERGR